MPHYRCFHRRVLPPPHGPQGLYTNILTPKGKGKGQTPRRALTITKPEFQLQRNHFRTIYTKLSSQNNLHKLFHRAHSLFCELAGEVFTYRAQ